MFDIGWSELLVVAVVMVLVVGPKELPGMLRTIGSTIKKVRGMAGDFQRQFDEALKDAELDGVKDTIADVQSMNPANAIKDKLNPLKADLENVESEVKSSFDYDPDELFDEDKAPKVAEPVKVDVEAALAKHGDTTKQSGEMAVPGFASAPPADEAVAKKAPAKKTPARKSTAKKPATKRTTVKKPAAAAKSTTAKKTTARKISTGTTSKSAPGSTTRSSTAKTGSSAASGRKPAAKSAAAKTAAKSAGSTSGNATTKTTASKTAASSAGKTNTRKTAAPKTTARKTTTRKTATRRTASKAVADASGAS
ncbi:MAG: Sec-independent protein translocase protein TatB [Pseudomonadota bacterium]